LNFLDKGEYAHYEGEAVNFLNLMERENKGQLVDFLSLDAEGAEYALLPLLHSGFFVLTG
jgi:hypothetical protein